MASRRRSWRVARAADAPAKVSSSLRISSNNAWPIRGEVLMGPSSLGSLAVRVAHSAERSQSAGQPGHPCLEMWHAVANAQVTLGSKIGTRSDEQTRGLGQMKRQGLCTQGNMTFDERQPSALGSFSGHEVRMAPHPLIENFEI